MNRILDYRPDIDGLRAISVLAVLLYHAGLPGFPGGYVGVDVFFVISGYVITNLIRKDIAQGQFTMPRFWARRARRILPAMLTVMIFSIITAWFLLMPNDFKNFGRSLFSQALSVSNIYFWLKSGYFNEMAETIPLLHTWSLSVEEQFYVFFPFLLVLLLKLSQRGRVAIIILLIGLSLGVGEYYLVGQRDAVFFLLPTRAWELLLGALITETSFKVSEEKGWWLEILAVVGLGAVLVAATTYGKNTPFPGIAALLPCGGSAAIIFAGRIRRTRVTRLLSSAPLVFIGLISYSLYLWHWPILVYFRYATVSELGYGLAILALTIAFGCAAFSYKYIETPFRRGWIQPRKAILSLSVAILVAAGCGALINAKDGYPSRISDVVLNVEVKGFETIPSKSQPLRITDKLSVSVLSTDSPPDLILWGDSHAGVISPLLEELAIKHRKNLMVYGCIPVLDVYEPQKDKQLESSTCYQSNRDLIDFIREKKVRTVVLASFWSNFTEDGEVSMEGAGIEQRFYADASIVPRNAAQAKQVFERHFLATIETLKSLGVEIYIVNQVPIYRYWVSRHLAKMLRFGADPASIRRPLAEHHERMAFINSVFSKISDARVHVLDPASFLCSDSTGYCYGVDGNIPLYRDFNHLTLAGTKRIQPLLESIFAIK